MLSHQFWFFQISTRNFVLTVFAIGVSILYSTATQAVTSEYYNISKAEKWVEEVTVDASNAPVLEGSVSYQLLDWQTMYERDELSEFSHIVLKVNNTSGLEEAAKTSIRFDPSYQSLVLHKFNIIRDDKIYDRLNNALISVAKTESDIENNLLNGEVTALILMRDIRVGDQIDYSYTIKGLNPVFKGHFSKSISFDWGIDVGVTEYRFTSPSSVNIQYRLNEIQEPDKKTKNGYNHLHWKLDRVNKQTYEKNTPNWFSLGPEIQLSSFQNWNDVATWGSQLFTDRSVDHESLYRIIANFSQNSSTYKISHTLDYVQQNIRYFGIEMGANSHLPHSPVDVVELGYGDCKDKTLLYISLLQEMGINAYPALVSTNLRTTVRDKLPGSNWFNHVIALVEVGDHEYWLDPTMSNERGKIEYRRAANYGTALILGHPNKLLVSIPDIPSAIPNVEANERIYLAHKHTPSRYEIKTIFRQQSANSLRSKLLSRGHKAVEESFLDLMKNMYKQVSLAQSTNFVDQEEQNMIVVTEQYLIDDMITLENNQLEFYLEKYTFTGLLPDNSYRRREQPLYAQGPASWKQHTTIVYPYTFATDIAANSQVQNFSTESIKYSSYSSTIGRFETISSELEILSDYIPADEYKKYRELRDNVNRDLGITYNFTTPTDTKLVDSAVTNLMNQLETIGQTASAK